MDLSANFPFAPSTLTWRPLRPTLRLLRALGRLAIDVDRIDEVFEMNDDLLALATKQEIDDVLEDFRSTEQGRDAMRVRATLGNIDLETMRSLPGGTLGGALARFLDERELSRDDLIRYEADTDLNYLLVHFYETHDLWHVLAGFDTDPAGELGVQAMLLAQSRAYLPLFVMAAILLNTALSAYEECDARMDALAHGWLIGRESASLVGFDFAKQLDRPLDELREELRIRPFGGVQ